MGYSDMGCCPYNKYVIYYTSSNKRNMYNTFISHQSILMFSRKLSVELGFTFLQVLTMHFTNVWKTVWSIGIFISYIL